MSTEFSFSRLGFTEIPRQDASSAPALVMIFVHGLRGSPQTTWTKTQSSSKASQDHVNKSRSKWLSWRQTWNTLPAKSPNSIPAALPSQVITHHEDCEGSPDSVTLPAPRLAPSMSSWTQFCWPKDDLPNRLPNVQILLYGYEADIIGPFQAKSQNTITTHGNNFLIALERKLPKDVPLVFVAHSLGGILVKDLLCLSKSHIQDRYRSIHSNTRRVVFMGTPHRGSDLAGLATILANITKVAIQNPNKGLLRSLDQGSEILDRIHTSFMQLLVKPDFAIHCFQEDRGPTWIPGLTGLVVDNQSSKTGSPHETCETIAANHMDMVAYNGSEDDNYLQVSAALVSFVKDIIDTSPPSSRRSLMGTLMSSSNNTNISEFLARLNSLSAHFPQSPNPHVKEQADVRALEWFFESPEYSQWSRESGVLWLSGIPGSGKTVLSFHLWTRLKRKQTHTNQDVAAFFCSTLSDKGLPAENYTTDILISIIDQLLRSNPERLDLVVQHCQARKPLSQTTSGSFPESFLDQLWNLLLVSITAIPSSPVVIIIDGIDELRIEETRRTLCKDLLQLQTSLASRAIHGCKIFIASRPYNDIKEALAGALHVERDKERQKCLQTLRFDELHARRDRIDQVHQNTGSWLRDDIGYISWSSSDRSEMLLIQGKPGSGKSTLAKFMLDTLKSEHGFEEDASDKGAKGQENVLIADFFYSFRGGKTETSNRLMLQSILYQLLSQDDRLFTLFRDTHRAHASGGSQLPWTWDELRKVFASLRSFEACKRIYILVDAMDESDEQGRPETLQLLTQLCSAKSGCAIKALIATRPLRPGEIDAGSIHCHRIVLQDRNRKDIEHAIVAGLSAIKDIPEAPLIDFGFVKNYMVKNAAGVFLWVVLVFKELKELVVEGCSQVDLEVCLTKLPTELQDMYRLIIHRLLNQQKHNLDSEKVKKGAQMLRWATFAERPLTTEEFRDAIAIPPTPEPFIPDKDFLSRNRISGVDLRIKAFCGGLLEIREPVVQLLHQTCRDFLLRKDRAAAPFNMDEMTGDSDISSACIRYLCLLSVRANSQAIGSWSQTNYDEFVGWLTDYSLLEYIVSSLPRHMKSLTAGSPFYGDLSLFVQILESDYILFCLFDCWTELVAGQRLRGRQQNIRPSYFRTRVLIAAAQAGYGTLVKVITQLQTDINARDETSGMSALFAAAKNGHFSTVRVIVVQGADVNAQGDYYGSNALQAASFGGHEHVVRLLLGEGADVNAQGGDYGNALQAASEGGYQQIVQLLLDAGANVNAQGDNYSGNALQAASYSGNLQLLQLLVDWGANVDAQGGYYGSALQVASVRGHEQMVRLLLDKRADVNAQGGIYGNALQAASLGGHTAVVQMLLDKGANVHIQGGEYGNALQAASQGGHTAVVQMLLDKDADVNAEGGIYGNALYAASQGGHTALVHILTAYGAITPSQGQSM